MISTPTGHNYPTGTNHDPATTASRLCMDPRTTLLAVVVVNATALSHGSLPTLVVCVVFTAACLSTVAPRYALGSVAIFLAFYLGYWGLLHLPGSKLFAFTAAMLLWMSRFTISMAIGGFALLTLTPSTMTSALRRMHLPGWATIPPAVFLRVLPIIAAEARAIRDAMQLRGLQPGLRSWLTHPSQSSAMLIIPLLGAVVRAGDDLASSALLRGLGGPAYPTTTVKLSFKLIDAAALVGLLLVVASLHFTGGLWR